MRGPTATVTIRNCTIANCFAQVLHAYDYMHTQLADKRGVQCMWDACTVEDVGCMCAQCTEEDARVHTIMETLIPCADRW